MLIALEIQNYALIQHTRVEFCNGLNIITGETGAGKSIMLGALGLALGNRADASQLANPDLKCWIEATFSIEGLNLKAFFEENDLDYHPVTLLRREILPGGRSRMFVNDSPATLAQVKALSEHLLDIHNQHENLLLKSSGFLLEVVDILAGTLPERLNFHEHYSRYKLLEAAEKKARDEFENAKVEQDFLAFQVEEWKALNWEAGMQEVLENKQERIENASKLAELKSEAEALVYAEETGLLDRINQLQQRLIKIETHGRLSGWSERLVSARIELQEIMSELDRELESITSDSPESEEVADKLDNFYSLLRKHRVSVESELIAKLEAMEGALGSIEEKEDRWKALQADLGIAEKRMSDAGFHLRMRRVESLQQVTDMLLPDIQLLGMRHATINLTLIPKTQAASDGLDELKFLFSANPGTLPDDVAKVASGGEISRIMLLLKQGIAQKRAYPTLLFDEIDTGVSGAVADKMGAMLKETSRNMQLIVITHLPQIAAKGDAHFVVRKDSDGTQTSTSLHPCNEEDRILEIAALLSGAKLSQSAIENAKSLLGLK